MPNDRFNRMKSAMAGIAEVVNAFKSDQVQQLAFQALVNALSGQKTDISGGKSVGEGSEGGREKRPQQPKQTVTTEEPGVQIPQIVSAIKDADDYDEIEKNILNKSAQLPRVLLCLHYAAQVSGPDALTTGQIAYIAHQLDVGIKAPNVNKTIRKNSKYFASDAARRPGAKVPYRLNRRGKDAYAKAVKGEKL